MNINIKGIFFLMFYNHAKQSKPQSTIKTWVKLQEKRVKNGKKNEQNNK